MSLKKFAVGTLSTVIAGVIVAVVDNNLATKDIDQVNQSIRFPPVAIRLIGSNSELLIVGTEENFPLSNLSVTGSNLYRELTLPVGQALSLKLIGSNNSVAIDKSVFHQIQVENVGPNNDVFRGFD
jgi:hypothetical protein